MMPFRLLLFFHCKLASVPVAAAYLCLVRPKAVSVANDEILRVEKLIAGMRHVLSVVCATTDVEKLVALAREEWPAWVSSLGTLYQLGIISPDDIMTVRMDSFWGVAVVIERFPDLKARLTEIVAQEAHRVDSILQQAAQSLHRREV
jgi:hypothetical protein